MMNIHDIPTVCELVQRLEEQYHTAVRQERQRDEHSPWARCNNNNNNNNNSNNNNSNGSDNSKWETSTTVTGAAAGGAERLPESKL